MEAVPYGSIKNPAAYAHRIALKTRRRLVEMTPPGQFRRSQGLLSALTNTDSPHTFSLSNKVCS